MYNHRIVIRGQQRVHQQHRPGAFAVEDAREHLLPHHRQQSPHLLQQFGVQFLSRLSAPGKQNGQQRSQKWLPSARRVTEGERGGHCGGCGTNGDRSIHGSRHQVRPTRSTGGSKQGRPWALTHVTPRPATVSQRPFLASHSPCHAYL